MRVSCSRCAFTSVSLQTTTNDNHCESIQKYYASDEISTTRTLRGLILFTQLLCHHPNLFAQLLHFLLWDDLKALPMVGMPMCDLSKHNQSTVITLCASDACSTCSRARCWATCERASLRLTFVYRAQSTAWCNGISSCTIKLYLCFATLL